MEELILKDLFRIKDVLKVCVWVGKIEIIDHIEKIELSDNINLLGVCSHKSDLPFETTA
jgi:hypothetical protein